MRISLTVFVLVMLVTSGPSVADKLSIGIAAYDSHIYVKSYKLLKPFADQGKAEAQLYLGFMYEEGNGVPKDYSVAMSWFQKAASQNNKEAIYWIGNLYAQGKGVNRNMPKAAKWYLKAAKLDHAVAQSKLGYMYQVGEGVPKNQSKSNAWYDKAANHDE